MRPSREPPAVPAMPRTVLVTGISGNLGRALAKLLHTETHVVGVDRRPFPGRPKDIAHHQVDIRKAKVEEAFRQRRIEALIHLGHHARPARCRGARPTPSTWSAPTRSSTCASATA